MTTRRKLILYITLWMVIILFTIIFSSNLSEGSTMNCPQMDMVILGDFSGSIRDQERIVLNAYQSFIDNLEISEGTIRVSIILFNSNATTYSELSGNKEELLTILNNMKRAFANGGTNLSQGLINAEYQFNINGRKGVPKTLIVISDGQPNNREYSKSLISSIKVSGISIYSIYVPSGDMPFGPYEDRSTWTYEGKQFMLDIATDERYYFESDYKQLSKTFNDLNFCM